MNKEEIFQTVKQKYSDYTIEFIDDIENMFSVDIPIYRIKVNNYQLPHLFLTKELLDNLETYGSDNTVKEILDACYKHIDHYLLIKDTIK